MEYVSGGELFYLLKQQKSFPEHCAQFITAQVVLGLEYMHMTLKIIYRDLKPENILLTEDGYIKITDFGLCKPFRRDEDMTYTMAGTVEYLSPEIINGLGHNKLVDFWCLGIFTYELLNGNPPFVD